MKTHSQTRLANWYPRLLLVWIAAAVMPLVADAAPTGSIFTYQGRLNISGAPATDGVYDFRFTLHDASEAGSAIGGAVLVNALGVTNGLFTATLDFGSTPFTSGEARWLQLQVNTNGVAPLVTLNPRQRITPTPQAIYAENAGMASAVAAGAVTSAGIAPSAVDSESIQNGSIEATDLSPSLFNETFWKLGGNQGGGNFLGSLDSQPVELRAGNQTALRLLPSSSTPNVVGGHASNRVGPSAAGAFIGGGGLMDYSNFVATSFGVIGGGVRNTAAGLGAVVGGGLTNGASGTGALVSGGSRNVASAPYTTVGGGFMNMVFDTNGTIAGGMNNRVFAGLGAATIGGGIGNMVADSQAATIAGGIQHIIDGSSYTATIGGGYQNYVRTNGAGGTVGGGAFNVVTEGYGTIGGGHFNTVHAENSTIGGGFKNRADAAYSTVGGGRENTNSSIHATIGGGANNLTLAEYASTGGGSSNTVEGAFGTVGGGRANRAENLHATVAGGGENRAQSTNSTVSGGLNNDVSGDSAAGATISGGVNNYIRDSQAGVIAGGLQNHISGSSTTATVGGGYQNFIEAGSDAATIQGGFFNLITSGDYSSIGGGSFNTNSGNYSTVPGGTRNAATGDYALAAGRRAKAGHNGSFVWADDTDADFASTTNKQFAVRANNGVMIQATDTALDLRGGGAVRVAGAGVNTTTPVFIHRASATSISANTTVIDHPHCNGNPNAILIITHNYSADTAANRYETEPVGVWYNGTRWTIFHENSGVVMPVGRAFNVMVFKP